MQCGCKGERNSEFLGNWAKCPLTGNGHTQFFLEKCMDCKGVIGFPGLNLKLALLNGTPETKETLQKIIENPDILKTEEFPEISRTNPFYEFKEKVEKGEIK